MKMRFNNFLITNLVLLFIIVLLPETTQSQTDEDGKVVLYTLDNKISESNNYINTHIDVPVFSGVFGGDHYGFSVGGQVSACIKSKIVLTGRMSYNLTPEITSLQDDLLEYIYFDGDQINTGRTQFTGVMRFNITSDIKNSAISEAIGFQNDTMYYVKTDVPVLTNYGIRLGVSRFANTAKFKSIIDLPYKNLENDVTSYYTSDNARNGLAILGWGVQMANPRTALRVGVAREVMTRYEFTINNIEDFNFLTKKNKKQRGGFIIKHYADILIGINKTSMTPLEVEYREKDDSDDILVSNPETYDITPLLNYLPVGVSVGIEHVTWAKRVSRSLYAEAGLAPGYGNSLANNFYAKFGIRLGISQMNFN